MSNGSNETTKDITEMLRGVAGFIDKTGCRASGNDLRIWADRIDAAVAREHEAHAPKPDPNWKDICTKCADGDIEPHFCRYYGDPNGCNSPIYGQHPAAETPDGNSAVMREALLSVRKPIAYRGGDLARYILPVIDAALKTPPEPAGNAAMMRMALEVLWDVIGQFSKNILDGQMQLVLSDMLIPAKNAYHHALAAPPRNCDVGTPEEQALRYGRFCDKFVSDKMHCETCPCCGKIPFGKCEFAWAQMPYKEGEGAE